MDGAFELRKRHKTRLWFRAMPDPIRTAAVPASAVTGAEADEAAWAELLADPSNDPVTVVPAPAPAPAVAPVPAVAAAPLASVIVAPVARPSQPQPARGAATAQRRAPTLDEWRTVPEAAPSLLLSATDLLDARDPGPVLRPGTRYRVASIQNGIVGLHVGGADGEIGLGYCTAVDLICIDTRFGGPRTGRAFATPGSSFRATMARLTDGLTQATMSIRGGASTHG
jgi:hypothetical protein